MENLEGSTFKQQLPDFEFDLPELKDGELPSLESILQEKESDVYNFEELNVLHQDEVAQSDDGNCSITSEALPVPQVNLSDLLKPKKPSAHGSVLRHVILRKLSSQMNDACSRRDAGLPTCMAVSSLIVIGTSRGLLLVFEPRDQILKLILGTKEDGDNHGAVTALGINCDCTRLLCGYARGHVTMWDLTNGNCLRVITEAHPVGYAVLHIQFTDDPTVAMLNDSSGSLYTLSFKRRILRTCESSCFFSGAKGEVCAMAPLHVSPDLKKSPSCNVSLLAMASLTKLIIVDMSDKPVAVFTQKMSGRQNCLPLLCWYFTLLEPKGIGKVIVPVLAFGLNQTILLYKVQKVEEQCVFECYRTHVFNYSMIAMAWLNSQVIITVDTLELIRTIDANSGEELECLDLSSVQMVYSTSYFKSLPNGGNVSCALHQASEYACYQSLQFFNGQLLFLGTKSIHCLTIRNWKDRLDFFIKRNEFLEALELGKMFYLEKGKAVLGLVGSKKVKRGLVSMEILSILLSYLDVSIIVNCPKTNDEAVLRPFYQHLVRKGIEYCILIDDLPSLFTEVYERFSDGSVAKEEFLHGLEYFILEDELASLSPVLMQDFVENFEVSGRLQNLQQCVVHLDLSTIDIDHMIRLCRDHCLYDLIIYVYNKGLNDYITPFESLLGVIRQAINDARRHVDDTAAAITDESKEIKISDDNLMLGQKLLVYLSCCLAGHQYPLGRIRQELVDMVKSSVFEFVFSKHTKTSSSDDGGSVEKYGNVATLLYFDTQELLNVLSLAFEEKEFDLIQTDELRFTSKRQQVVDILLDVMLNSDGKFSTNQIGCLFIFIARQMSKHGDSIHINYTLFEEVLEYITSPGNEKRHEERQQAMLELQANGGLDRCDIDHVLQLAEDAKFYRVCEIIYQKEKEYYKVMSCYWRDNSRKHQIYSYLDNLVTDEACTDLEKEAILEALLKGMDFLVEINSMKFARLIINDFPAAFNNVASKLQDKPEIQYAFLKGVFHAKTEVKAEQQKFNINPVLHETFIELMCVYEPNIVCSYLQSTDTYRLQEVLEIVRAENLIQASAYLYERMGDIKSAFELLSGDLQEKVDDVNCAFLELDDTTPQTSTKTADSDELFDDVKRALNHCKKSLQTVMRMCQRNCSRMESEDRSALWFPLLETMMKPQRKIKNTSSQHFLVFKELTKDVLINMMEYISLPAVLQKIMQDQTYSSGKFSDIKDIVFGMIDTYNYELTLLKTTNNLLGNDLLGQYNHERRVLSRGFRPNVNRCYLCTRNYSINNNGSGGGEKGGVKEIGNEFVLFRCGHTYHRKCLQSSVGFDEDLICLQCDKSNRIRSTGSFSRTMSREKRGKSVLKKNTTNPTPGDAAMGTRVRGDSTEHYHGQLSEHQERALDRLWNLEDNSSEMKYLFDTSRRGFYIHAN